MGRGGERKARRAESRKAREIRRKEREERETRLLSEYGHVAVMSCGRKYRYETKDEALEFAAHRSRKEWKMLRVYQCAYCGGWHITHKPERE